MASVDSLQEETWKIDRETVMWEVNINITKEWLAQAGRLKSDASLNFWKNGSNKAL